MPENLPCDDLVQRYSTYWVCIPLLALCVVIYTDCADELRALEQRVLSQPNLKPFCLENSASQTTHSTAIVGKVANYNNQCIIPDCRCNVLPAEECNILPAEEGGAGTWRQPATEGCLAVRGCNWMQTSRELFLGTLFTDNGIDTFVKTVAEDISNRRPVWEYLSTTNSSVRRRKPQPGEETTSGNLE